MKVLIVNACDIRGGAARAAYRLHQGLINEKIDSQILVQEKKSNDPKVILANSFFKNINSFVRPALDKLPLLAYPNKTSTLFSPNWVPFGVVPKEIERLDPDIVHLHWINRGFLSIEDISKIKKPLVWTMHDMWPFTGGEHYDENQSHYQASCGKSFVLNSKNPKDLSYRTWKKKKQYWKDLDLTIVSPSNWLAQCAKKSSLFNNKRIEIIPNGIDTNLFKPIDKKECRRELNFPLEKKLVLFGGIASLNDPRKGFRELQYALKSSFLDIELVVFGNESNIDFGVKTHFLGNINNDNRLAKIYSSADMTIVPSKQENLSNIIMESLSCGTPVIGFDIGGNADMIEHQKTGFLVRDFSKEGLISGIQFLLEEEIIKKIRSNCREKVIREFDIRLISKKFIDLYKKIKNREYENGLQSL